MKCLIHLLYYIIKASYSHLYSQLLQTVTGIVEVEALLSGSYQGILHAAGRW